MIAESATLLRRTISQRTAEEFVVDLLDRAGITVGGRQPYDIDVRDVRFFQRVVRDGSLGFGEAYVDGWWDARAVDQTISRLLEAKLDQVIRHSYRRIAHALRAKALNLQSVTRAFEVGEKHYDIGNDLYKAMLDSRMIYSCGYWKNANDLESAQESKLELVCRKIGLKPGSRVLDIGCGWGGFAKFAAERHGATVTGLTVSGEQAEVATVRCRGLPVEIVIGDYRGAQGTYDAVISIGTMEHIGPKNYRTYMEVVDRCMKPGGVALVHTIAGNRSIDHMEPWIEKYVFPNAVLPTVAMLAKSMEQLMIIEDMQNIGPDYDDTLMAWHRNFENAWPWLAPKYGQRFYRLWRYYLLSAAAGFRVRYTQVYQVVMTRTGTPKPDCRHS